MKSLRMILGILLAIVALNAFAGGYYGMDGAKNVPLEWLNGSPFSSYFIPSAFLFIIIGGGCLTASIFVFSNSVYARAVSFICAGLLISWIIAQIAIIGYVSWMQPAILLAGLTVFVLALFLPRQKYLVA